MTEGSAGPDPVDVVARAWLTKMRGEDAAAVRDEFEEWLAASAAHRAAYARIERMMAASAVLKTSARHGTAHAPRRQRKARRWLPLGAVATAAALLILAIGVGGASLPGVIPNTGPTAQATERLVTMRGEIRRFQLADGLSVTLDTDSQAEFDRPDNGSRLRLLKGRARVSRAETGGILRVEAGKAAFEIEDADLDISVNSAGSTIAAVRRGSVRGGTRGAGPSTRFADGRQIAVGPDGQMRSSAPSRDTIPSDWPSGWAEYRSIRLDRLVTEANRYAGTPIMLDDPSLGSIELSGRFHVSETDAFIRRTAELLDLSVEKNSAAIHLSRR
jgi:transmembrane sensor